MPTYEYACAACGNEYERFESITAKPNRACPKCKAKKGERKISGGGGFIFKGTGFYITDYKKGGGGTKTDGKPADKTENKPAETVASDSSSTSSGSCSTGCGCHSAPAAAKVDTAKSSSAKPAPAKSSSK